MEINAKQNTSLSYERTEQELDSNDEVEDDDEYELDEEDNDDDDDDDDNNELESENICTSKFVEQLHIDTGKVLRVYPSQGHAAKFMKFSQASISRCCNNKLSSYQGFAWRFYRGPPIDCTCIVCKFFTFITLYIF